MARRARRATSKRSAGRPATGQNVMIAIRWSPQLIDGIDRYAREQVLTRGAALRQIVGKYLVQSGVIRP
jgi:hypothetical protein